MQFPTEMLAKRAYPCAVKVDQNLKKSFKVIVYVNTPKE
jgi:hypothetical protein